MSDYVVDASVIIEYLIETTYTANAEALIDHLADTDRLIVPEFCLLECTNVLWKQVRFQGMAEAQSQELPTDLRSLRLSRVEVKEDLDTALKIGVKHKLAVYDSAYIALALRLGYPIITIDQPQSRAASAEGVSLKSIMDFS